MKVTPSFRLHQPPDNWACAYWRELYPNPVSHLVDDRFGSPKRAWIDSLRSVYWVLNLKHSTGFATNYRLEKRFEPGAFRVSPDGISYRLNKWRSYAQGLHVPKLDLIEKVGDEIPGSESAFTHVLWDLLRDRSEISSRLAQWLQQVPLEIRDLAFRTRRLGSTVTLERMTCTCARLEQIGMHAGFDVLALLILLLFSSDQDNSSWPKDGVPEWVSITRCLYRVLLAVCSLEPMAPIAEPFFHLFYSRIFPHAADKFVKAWFEITSIRGDCFLLHLVTTRYEDKSLRFPVTMSQKINNRFWIQSGAAGLDVLCALAPLFVSVTRDLKETPKHEKAFRYAVAYRAWARTALMQGRREGVPPFKMIKQQEKLHHDECKMYRQSRIKDDR